jgi:hypothetical protein
MSVSSVNQNAPGQGAQAPAPGDTSQGQGTTDESKSGNNNSDFLAINSDRGREIAAAAKDRNAGHPTGDDLMQLGGYAKDSPNNPDAPNKGPSGHPSSSGQATLTAMDMELAKGSKENPLQPSQNSSAPTNATMAS